MEGTGANQRLTLNTPFFFESQISYDRTSGPGTFATGFEGLQALDRPSGQLRAWDPNIRPQLTHQWNLFGEYLLGSRSSINIGYVGSDSKYIIMTIDANQPLPGTGPANTWLPAQQRRPLYPFNPDITFMIQTTARGIANYNALQTTFKQRLSQRAGLQCQLHVEQGDDEQPRVLRLRRRRRRARPPLRRWTAAISTPTTDRPSSTPPTCFQWRGTTICRSAEIAPSAAVGTAFSMQWRAGGRPVRCDRAQWIPNHRARQLVAFAAGLPLDRAAGPYRQRGSGRPDARTVDRSVPPSARPRKVNSATLGSASCARRASGMSTSPSARGWRRLDRTTC